MTLWLLILLFHPIFSIQIFRFESSSAQNISYGIIKTSTPLPPIFTLCASIKEIFDEHSFFTLYGELGEPWMILINWVDTDFDISMWIKINTVWVKIRDIDFSWIDSWIQVCVRADTTAGNLSISVNGEPSSSFQITELTVKVSKNLRNKLYIGLSHHDNGIQQYQGELTNFNMFSSENDIVNMSANPCELEGDIVNKDTEWKIVGAVTERSEEAWKICNRNVTYRVGIPAKMSWDTATLLCDNLGEGNMTEPQHKQDMKHIISMFEKMNSSCTQVWTPINDEEVEGEFKSSVTGNVVTYQPWLEGMPNGGETQNHVAINMEFKMLQDNHKSELRCSACEINKALKLTLIGVCKDTYFGKLASTGLSCIFNLLYRFPVCSQEFTPGS